jgi:AcrR family transcriptional regulator
MDTLGLRDRKRIETRQRLERAALDLALRDGIELATIDAISDRADVSPRTFFNYFESKEDAILGLRDLELSDETVARHIADTDGADVLESTVRLLVTVIGGTIADSEIRSSRVALVHRNPQLLSRHVSQMTRMAGELTSAVRAIIAHGDPVVDPGAPSADAADAATAELILSICGAAVRSSVMELVVAHGDTTPEQLEKRAVELVRKALRTLR